MVVMDSTTTADFDASKWEKVLKYLPSLMLYDKKEAKRNGQHRLLPGALPMTRTATTPTQRAKAPPSMPNGIDRIIDELLNKRMAA